MQEIPKTGYCMFGSRQGIPGCDRVQEIPRQTTVGFGSRQGIPSRNRGFLVTTKFIPGSVSQQEFRVATWFSDFKS